MKEKIKIIYISGIGRSGSTLLDVIISTSPQVFSVGEIYKYNQLKKDNVVCSCGKSFKTCKFWKNFVKDDTSIVNRMNVGDYLKMLNFLYDPFSKKIKFKKKSEDYGLFKKIKKELPKTNEYILDHSKDILRLMELDANPKLEVYNISVVRDGRAVANSFNSKTQSKGKNYFVSLLKWIFINKCMFKYLEKRKGKNMVISYDLFCKNSDKHLKKIIKFLGVKIPKNYISRIREMDYHNIGGNRLYLKENREKIKEIKHDEKWKVEQGGLAKAIATVLSYTINKRRVDEQ